MAAEEGGAPDPPEAERQVGAEAERQLGGPGGRFGSWRLDPWVRFTLIFAVLALSSEILYYAVVLGSSGLESYLSTIARVSGRLIAFFDPQVEVDGAQIGSTFFIVDIAPECDAIQLSALLSSAMIAFPASLARKLGGVVLGLLWIQLVNFGRIVSLYYVGGMYEDHFETAHKVAWPALLIVITVASWIVWARWVTRDEPSPASAA